MAYVKTNWQTGDVITANKLNNMETGIYDATEAAAAAFAPDIDDPQNGDVIKYDSSEGKWVNGSAGSAGGFSPDIVDPQDGDVIKYDSAEGKWVNDVDSTVEDFIITCTPTSASGFDGTMDATCEEITEAYDAHKNIIFVFEQANVDSYIIPSCYNIITVGSSRHVQVLFFMTYTNNGAVYLIRGMTGVSSDSDVSYTTDIFQLTTASI